MSNQVLKFDDIGRPFPTRKAAQQTIQARGWNPRTHTIEPQGSGFVVIETVADAPAAATSETPPVSAESLPETPPPANPGEELKADILTSVHQMIEANNRELIGQIASLLQARPPVAVPSAASGAHQASPVASPWNTAQTAPRPFTHDPRADQPAPFGRGPFRLAFFWVEPHISSDPNASPYVPLVVQGQKFRLTRGRRFPLSTSHIEALMQTAHIHYTRKPGMPRPLESMVHVYPFSVFEECDETTYQRWLTEGTETLSQEMRSDTNRAHVEAVQQGLITPR